LDATDLEFRVDTHPDEVHRFLDRETSDIKVVFATYHSSPVVSEGVRGLAPFDVAIFDEAHKTTGPQGGLFAHCLLEEIFAFGNDCFSRRLHGTMTLDIAIARVISRSNQWTIRQYTVRVLTR
jgi:hypothetical protein